MWVTKLLISPEKIRIFCPRTTKFGPQLAFLFILGQGLLAHLVPCWWVGWWLWRGLYLARHLFTLYHTIYCLSSIVTALTGYHLVPNKGELINNLCPQVSSSQYHSQDEEGNYAFGYNNVNGAREEVNISCTTILDQLK